MTRRPTFVYAVFAVCLLIAGLAATWLSWTVLERDRAEALARRQALLEENTRLALWRLDSEIATLIATENARPYFDYAAFRALDRAYTAMVDDFGPNEVVAASPLLTARPKYVKLHFQFVSERSPTSPQVPAPRFIERALKIVGAAALEEAESNLARLASFTTERELAAMLDRAAAASVARRPPPPPPPVRRPSSDAFALVQRSRGANEYAKRSQSLMQASTYNVAPNDALANPLIGQRGDLEGRVAEQSLTPLWVADELLLVRRVVVGSRTYVQGLWLDWDTMRAALREGIEDLLPSAELESVRDPVRVESADLLASLPVRLVPGPLPYPVGGTSFATELSLAAVWVGFVIAGSAILLLLIGAMSLSERRAAFVSAVTHELRTPLTTFRMYTEMLSEGMVSENKRKKYLETLRREAVRLAHLVENVLAYARIERGRAAAPPSRIEVRDLLGRMMERLADRALQAEMTIVYSPPDEGLCVKVDASAVEQILFNLVDNACKYASGPDVEDRRIHVEVRALAGWVHLEVWDHGPGIRGEERRSLFSPFSKSAQRAAMSAPGVGLGLALSRRLAESMGGRLSHQDAPEGGASFTLSFRWV